MDETRIPNSLTVNGKAYKIRPDYHEGLYLTAQAFQDPELTDAEKAMLLLMNVYADEKSIPLEDLSAAYEAVIEFWKLAARSNGQKEDTQ